MYVTSDAQAFGIARYIAAAQVASESLQVFKTLENSNPAAVPGPGDGVTLLAPTDTAFVTLLADSGGRKTESHRF
jgi:hypothetical protein